MKIQPVLINGQWRESVSSSSFHAFDPATREPLPGEYPVSSWSDCEAAVAAASEAAREMRRLSGKQIAGFLNAYADRIDAIRDELVAMAHAETALPASPRLADVELPRTTGQLRQAAHAAFDGSWAHATIDTQNNIRSMFGPIGPVCVFGPNNFPFAFGSVSGGDFAAAIAAGNPVIGKANSSHPGTTRLFAEQALLAAEATGVPRAIVQMLYRTSHADGERLAADPRMGAIGYTGSRGAGLKLKHAADLAGNPIYLELSSVNPVVLLPGAIQQKGSQFVDEFAVSCLMGTGQFCTNPGTLLVIDNESSRGLVDQIRQRFEEAPTGTLLSSSVESSFASGVDMLTKAGVNVLTRSENKGKGYCQPNTLLAVTGDRFLAEPHTMQTEVFGNASLVVRAKDLAQLLSILQTLEGNLTGCIYSADDGSDDAAYDQISAAMRTRVGRLLNDKMPTGVAVSPAMNHGGPFPSTGHPGFTAVGIPASLPRFGMLMCYDNVRPHRLPAALQNKNPNGQMWRLIDGQWTVGDVG